MLSGILGGTMESTGGDPNFCTPLAKQGVSRSGCRAALQAKSGACSLKAKLYPSHSAKGYNTSSKLDMVILALTRYRSSEHLANFYG